MKIYVETKTTKNTMEREILTVRISRAVWKKRHESVEAFETMFGAILEQTMRKTTFPPNAVYINRLSYHRAELF